MKRTISPEIERVVKQSTLSLNGEDGNVIVDNVQDIVYSKNGHDIVNSKF